MAKERLNRDAKESAAASSGGSFSWFSATITMPVLCAKLAGQMGKPVTDQTGLEGRYRVELRTSSGGPDDPGFSLFDVVSHLGLKLEARKVPVEVLVIDQVMRVPSEN